MEKYLIIQTREDLSPLCLLSLLKASHLVLVLVCINSREVQAREGLLVTVEQRACEEIQ